MNFSPEPFWRTETCLFSRRRLAHLNYQVGSNSRAFTLIELVGVMAVVAILALALAPVMIKQLDQIAGDKETAQLKSFANSFRQGVLKSKIIPNEFGWDQMIAANSGMQISQVGFNDRR